MTLSNKKSIPLLVLFLLVFSYLLYHSTIHFFPSFIHAWTQSDRYAIALQFLNNGFDLFHPATYNLQTVEGITRVDFPINEYIVAILMKMLGTTAPIVFRVYTLCISFIGLIYLYLLSKKITGSEIKSWIVVMFVFFSPIYTYYQIGFIPSIPAIACLFAGYYYFFCYKDSQNKKQFLLAIIFFLLAALIRFPFIIFLFAAVLQQLWITLIERKIKSTEVIYFTAAFFIFVGYYLYNIHLGRIYGNMFLDSLMPANTFSELKEIISEMIHHWGFHYFSLYHYLLLAVTLGFSAYLFFKQKSCSSENKKYWFHLFIVSCGTFFYFLLMARQYFAHDYYFLDSLFTPIVLCFLFAVKSVPIQTATQRTVGISLILILSGAFYFSSQSIQQERYASAAWDRVEITHQNFIGTEKYLDKIGVSKDAKILVIDAYTTNTPLILMNRRGYTVLGTTAKNIATSLYWSKWNYVAIQDLYLVSDVITSYPLITSMLEKIGGNGKVSFYKRNSTFEKKSLKQFLGIKTENTLFTSFDSATTVAKLDSTTEYGITTSVKASQLNIEKNSKVLVRCNLIASQPINKIQLVVSVKNNSKTLYYQNFLLNDYFKTSPHQQQMEFQFVLPPFETPEDELKVYFWNPEKANLAYSNWEVIVYK